MKLRYGLAFVAAALITIPTASAASLSLASQNLNSGPDLHPERLSEGGHG